MRNRIVRGTVIAIFASLGAAMLAAAPAGAQPRSDGTAAGDQVVLHGSLVVPEGETVGAAVIFDGPATVDGTVTKSLVVFNGDVEISGTVRNDVVVFNGHVVLHPGARVQGNLVTRQAATIEPGATVDGSEQRVATKFDFGDLGLASRYAWWLAYSVSTLILGLLLLVFAPGLDLALARAARERMGASVGFGALCFFLLPVVAVLLLVTLVGLPLGLFLLLGLGLVYTVGYVVAAHAIGRLVLRRSPSRYVVFLAGWGIVRAIGLIPFLGGTVWVIAAALGLGISLMASRGIRGEEAPVGSPPPMPTMPADPS